MNRTQTSFRTLVFVPVLGIALLLAGCANDTGSATGSKSGAKKISLGVEGPVLVPTWVKAGDGAKAAAKDDGAIDLHWNAPATVDPSSAQAQVQAMVTQRVQGLGIAPFPTEAWTAALSRFGKQVQPTVAFGFQPTAAEQELANSPIKTYIGSGTISTGYDLAVTAIKKAAIPADTTGNVLLGQCVAGDSGLVWSRIEGVRRAVKEQLPKADIVDFISGVDLNENTRSWRAALASNKHVILTAGACEPDGASMIQAKQSAGVQAASVAFEPVEAVLKGVQDGTITAIGTMGNFHVGWILVKLLAAEVRGESPMPKGWIDTGFYIFTKDNIDQNMRGLNYDDPGYDGYWKAKAEEILRDLPSHTTPLADLYK